MKVTGGSMPPTALSPSLPLQGGHGDLQGVSQAKAVHLDTARHGIDGASFVTGMRGSPALAQFRESRQDGAMALRNAMARQFGSALVADLFNDKPQALAATAQPAFD